MTDTLQNILVSSSDEVEIKAAPKKRVKQELTPEEKKQKSRQSYLDLIERCKNGEYRSKEERKATQVVKVAPVKHAAKIKDLSPEALAEKQAAKALRLYTFNKKYRTEHREEYNTYMRTIMREKYRNDPTYRARLAELAKLRKGKNREEASLKKALRTKERRETHVEKMNEEKNVETL